MAMLRSLLLFTILTAGAAGPARAQEGGGLLEVNLGLTFWTIVIFLVVLAILTKFAYPPILGAVEAREQRLRELTEAAERDRAAAAELVEQHRKELQETRERIQQALDDSRSAAEKVREEMLADTRREKEEVDERARREIEQAERRAVVAVREEAVDVAIAAAEKLLRRNLTPDDNRRLVQEYLGDLEDRALASDVAVEV
ncbi:hypothetical protein BH23GEM4_BH23GEM4_05150 [soil metagenome]